MFLLMEIHAKAREAKTLERECETIVRHALLETEGEAAERLDGTLKELNGLLKGLIVSGSIDEAHMIIAVLEPSRLLHVSHAGRAEGYLVRKGLASQITEYTSGKPTPAFVHIASGQLEKHDVLIFSTQRLLRTLTPAQLSQMSQRSDDLLETLTKTLDTEGEHASLATLTLATAEEAADMEESPKYQTPMRSPIRDRRARERGTMSGLASYIPAISLPSLPSFSFLKSFSSSSGKVMKKGVSALPSMEFVDRMKGWFQDFRADLTNPKRKKRAHLLILAAAVAVLIVVWALAHFFTSSQRSKTKAELQNLVQQISAEVQTAENRRIIGDVDAANAILDRAEERAKQVMDNESGLFRVEALDLLDRIRSKKEEINNIVRLSPRVVANLGAKSSDIVAQGLIGIGDGEFVVYDRQDLYRILLNSVEEPTRLSDQELILDGENFSRFQSLVFLTKSNSVIEVVNGQSTPMKTEDPAGWMSGRAIKTYLRFLYLLSPEKKQIYKYEHLTNRYGVPVEYNVNGDLTGALDLAIDGDVYVLKDDGSVLNLFRGEARPFVIRKAPAGLLKDATKIYKTPSGNFYFLDPTNSRVIVASDGGATGESTYLRQYVIEGDKTSELKDLYVDGDDAHLYVLDAKHVYAIDLTK